MKFREIHILQGTLLVLLVSVCLLEALCGCGNDAKGNNTVSKAESFDQMFDKVVTSTDAKETERLIKEAKTDGRINYGQQRYLEAMVVYRGFMRFDSVLSMCQEITDLPEVKSDATLSYRIYALMTNAAASSASYADMIQYASHTVDLAKNLGKIDKEQEMRGTVGYGMILLGRQDDGFRMIDNALGVLDKMKEWNCMNSWLILSKLKIAGLDFQKRPTDILVACNNVLEKLRYMQENPDAIIKKPADWNNDHKAFAAALDLYRSQMYAYMAYANAQCGNRDAAMNSLALFDNTIYSKSVDGHRMIVSALCELGLYQRMLAAYACIDKANMADTLNETYSEELRAKAKAASAAGNTDMAKAYLQRTISLEDTLTRMRDLEQMSRTLSVYKVHEEQMRANKASFAVKIMVVVAVALFLVVLMAVFITVRIYRQNRVTKAKNKILIRNIEAAYSFRDKYESLQKSIENSVAASPEERNAPLLKAEARDEVETMSEDNRRLFTLIDTTVRDRQMYLDVDFQRQTLVETLNVDRNRIGRAIRDCSGFPNLSAYVNSFRLEYAYRLLRQIDMKMTIDNVARQSGFSTVRTFQRLFKDKYGMTPMEFRESVE